MKRICVAFILLLALILMAIGFENWEDKTLLKTKKPIKNCYPINYELFIAVGGGIEPPRGS
jgi:hypothetical protein